MTIIEFWQNCWRILTKFDEILTKSDEIWRILKKSDEKFVKNSSKVRQKLNNSSVRHFGWRTAFGQHLVGEKHWITHRGVVASRCKEWINRETYSTGRVDVWSTKLNENTWTVNADRRASSQTVESPALFHTCAVTSEHVCEVLSDFCRSRNCQARLATLP